MSDSPDDKSTPEGAQRQGHRRRLIGNIVAFLTSIAICLALFEIATRALARVPPPLKAHHPTLDRVYQPGLQRLAFNQEAGRKVSLRFNRAGFRGGDLPLQRSPDSRRIAVIGDSMIAALAVEESNTAVARLGQLLTESHPEKLWELQNFGVSGWSTGSALAAFREIVADYQPDVVLVAYFVGNDFADNSSRLSRRSRIYFSLDGTDGIRLEPSSSFARTRTADLLDRYSRFYSWWKSRTARMRKKVRKRSGNWIFCTDREERLVEAWELSFRLLRTLGDEVQAQGAQFAVLLLPSGEQIYDEPWQRTLSLFEERASCLDRDHPDRSLAAFARSESIALVSMTEAFRDAGISSRAVDTPPEQLLFFRGIGHFTRAGNQLAAEQIHRYLTSGEGQSLLKAALQP